ncbi:hypothetical protein BCR34DRAFT_601628 [Clohesyomyces aquaticus]|uniref:Maintenance of telomere capping protein 6 n=1 Tax=Clohesyomyces aquaticus TaxID=1231657 RepID=A0A1Y1ZLG8_9PLEO|nr:hypothetical protein BCR34DRAFT_601628 [Clohesyomyces aquaticus]
MSSSYAPDPGAELVRPWKNAFRAQRDVGLRIPMNFLTVPGVSLRAACFAHNQYEDQAFRNCFSNLLASGFQKFLIDIFWDTGRSEWSLCPVQIPDAEAPDTSVVITLSSSALGTTSRTSANVRNIRNLHAWGEPALTTCLSRGPDIQLLGRQDTPRSSASQLLSSSSVATPNTTSTVEGFTSSTVITSPTASATLVKFPNGEDVPLFELGSYNCTSTMTLGYLTGIIQDYLDESGTTTDAGPTYMILNIHAASDYRSPDRPAQQPSAQQLPGPQDLLSNIINGNLSGQFYTPQLLQDQRSNLNDTWYDVQVDALPVKAYYTASKDSANNIVTPDGWPNEAYAVFQKFYRLMAGFGSVDPQMADYNFSADADTIFSTGTFGTPQPISLNSDGSITSRCLFSPEAVTITAATNSSWASSTSPALDIDLNPNTTIPIPTISNLTSCGLSPLLNSTISNITADANPLPYLAFAHSTLWSWAPGEPANITDDDSRGRTNCAAMYASTPYPGRWRVIDCEARHRVACQDPKSPYRWLLSSDSVNYFSGDTACPSNTVFSVPHTALENAYLLSAIQASASQHPLSEPVVVNLNDIDVSDCWVEGVNGTCPYKPPNDANKVRVVVVPTVAAVIIFVLAALTFFVKCAANRREDKRGRRRRNVGGWDYEGVPS